MTRTGFTPVHAAGDAELVQQARDGDEVAFADLYRRYARMVHGLLLARIPLAEVDDLVQEVFLTARKQLNSLRDPAASGGWLATIARNRATDFHRRNPEVVGLPDNLEARDVTAERAEGVGRPGDRSQAAGYLTRNAGAQTR
jgi:DNA-directed RNA polymerase specialized sigma24 family protein